MGWSIWDKKKKLISDWRKFWLCNWRNINGEDKRKKKKLGFKYGLGFGSGFGFGSG